RDLVFSCVLGVVDSEPREICADGDFVRRSVVQTLQRAVEFFQIVIRAIKFAKRIECFTAGRGESGEARPKFFALARQVPFTGKTRQSDFVVGLVGSSVERSLPKGVELRVGAGLPRLPRGESLI